MKKIFTLSFLLSLVCITSWGQQQQTFNSSGTWTCPAGVTSVTVQCWGGGGAGGSAKANYTTFLGLILSRSYCYAGGGAGGAYTSKTIAVTPGTTYTVTVGAAVSASTSTAEGAIVNGNPSWFGSVSTIYAQGGAGGVSKTTNATSGSFTGAGGTASSAQSIGTTIFKGGNGASGNSIDGYGGGGGSSAGTASNGNAGSTFGIGGAAVTGGGAGGDGNDIIDIDGSGFDGAVPGGGGGGATANSPTAETGGSGAAGRVVINYALPTYIDSWISMSTGSAIWCAGETRNVSITVKNNGTATWTSGSTGVNFSYYWNNQTRDANTRILPFSGLAPGQQQTVTVPVIAPSAAGTYTLNFDLVKEQSCWFADNTSGCSGPGNIVYTTASQTISDLPSAVSITPASASICSGTVQTLTASGGTTSSTTTSTALSENFDGGISSASYLPSGWARSNNWGTGYSDFPNSHAVNSIGNTWPNAPTGYNGTGYCMFFYSYSIPDGGTGYLETPAMDLSAYTSATLTFYIYNSGGTDNIKVFAKQGSNSYTQVGVSAGYGSNLNSGTSWTQYSIDLSSFKGSGFTAVKLRFQGTSSGASNIGLDNVVVSGNISTVTQAPITWTPTTPINTLYTNAAATTSYTAGANLLTVYAKPTATTTYIATATNSAGCTSTANMIVTVKAQPTATLTGTPQAVCPSGTVGLTVNFTGTAPWTVGYTDGTTNYSVTTSSSSYALSAPVPNNISGSSNTVTYALRPTTFSDNSGCSNGTTSGTVAITVKSKALASVSAAPSTICSGGQTTLNFSSSTGSKISYSINNVAQASQLTLAAGGTVTGVPSGILTSSTTYTITNIAANTSNYCDNTSPAGLSATVAIQALPTVSAITVPSGGAYAQTGNTIQLSDAPSANTTGAWSTSNAAMATVNSTGLVTGTAEGTPTITYTVTDNTSLQCKNSATQVVRVYNPDYITKAAGDFSNAATWQIDRDDNTFATSVPVPSGTNYTSIKVQHALNLNQDFQVRAGVNFSLITGGTLNIAAGKVFSSLGTVDFANKLVTVKSDASGTGSIGQVASAIANAGNVTVERYTDGGSATSGRRAWRLLTSPVTGQTIRNAWQEGGATNTGYGSLITGESLTSSQAASTGFDYIGAGNHTSIKEYTNGAWVPLSTNLTTGTQIPLNSRQAYMLFVRGNRTVGATGAGVANIRANGTLRQGNQTVTIGNTAYTVVGNPYASTIDFGSIYQNNSAAIKDQFYLWNSKLGTYGAYVLVTHDGTNGGYKATPAQITGVSAQDNDNYRYIPSGSGFFALPTSNASSTTLTIRETDKASASNPPVNPFRVVTNATNQRNLVVNLNQKNSDGTSILADGFRAKFSADYEGNEEDNSALKPTNFNENLGLLKNGITHIVEAHDDVKASDTLQFRLWNVSLRNYEFQIMGENFTNAPGIKAWLEDSYLGTKQEIDLSGGVTTVGFDVKSDSGSWKSTRFRIVFQNTSTLLPVTITKVSAQPKNGGAEVAWTVSNEVNVKGYTVEKSTNGSTFTSAGTQQSAKNNPQAALTSYSGYDAKPQAGDNFYRIRIEDKDGKVSYSSVVKVTIGATGTGIQITLYPNPVREGKANLTLTNLKEGAYLVSVFSGNGQAVYQKKVTVSVSGASQTEQLLLGSNLAQGSYQIRIADSNGAILYTDKLIVTR